MNVQNPNHQIAMDLISQYGEDAESIAMLRAAEYAANLNTEEWLIWEGVISSPKIRIIHENHSTATRTQSRWC